MTESGWPLWSDTPEATSAILNCPGCGQPVNAAAAFCESCGTTLSPTEPAPAANPPTDGGSTQTRRLGVRNSQLTNCPACGGTIDSDGYCQTCGAKAPSARDHYQEVPSDWVAGVCDRGIQHSRNEDAMALWAQGNQAVLVVCDGVSTSPDSDVAAMIAATTARDLLVETVLGLAEGADAQTVLPDALTKAAAAANAEIAEITSPNSPNAASATFAVAVVLGGEVHYANVGDSRVYFLGEAERVLLTLDDSMAQAFIDQGMERAEAESLPRAHAITKWLGRDATDIVPRVGSYRIAEAGWVVVCSDGLWNYASAPEQLAAQLDAASLNQAPPVTLAQNLVTWANDQGGRDNITVALARFPTTSAATTLEAVQTASDPEVEEQREHG